MIISAAKLNFLLIRQSRVPWEAERDLVCSDMGSLPFSLDVIQKINGMSRGGYLP